MYHTAGVQVDRLHRELKEDTYQPLPVRQYPIQKRDKPGEYRMYQPRRSHGNVTVRTRPSMGFISTWSRLRSP